MINSHIFESYTATPAPPIEPCHVFLIDDDPDDRILAKREMEKSDFVKQVMTFSDGHSLTTYMRDNGFMDRSVMTFSPIMMLVDIEMPRKNGLDVIRELKSDPFLEPIPLIVLTGTQSTDKIQQARDLGANGVFRKPLRRQVLNRFFRKAWKWPPEDLWMM